MFDGEFFKLRDANTRRVYLVVPLSIITFSGVGMPPVSHNVVRAPFQHGVSFENFYLKPRLVNMSITLDAYTRMHLWTLRQGLIELLNPRMGTLQLELHYPDGRILSLHDVYYDDGVEGGLGAQGSPRQQRIALRLQADDPVWFGEYYTLNWTQTPVVIDELVFPATFPILFEGATNISAIQTITVQGTWPAFPTIVFTGPMNTPRITNLSTDASLQLNTGIAAGETVTITTLFPHKSVISSTRGNLYWALSEDSVMMDFFLLPNYENDGDTQLQVTAFGTSEDSNVTAAWHERWIGV